METKEFLGPIAKVAGKVQLLGVVMLVLGFLAVAAPQISGMTVSVIVGVELIGVGTAAKAAFS